VRKRIFHTFRSACEHHLVNFLFEEFNRNILIADNYKMEHLRSCVLCCCGTDIHYACWCWELFTKCGLSVSAE